MINSNVTTITLDGNEIKIEFSASYPYYQITNKGDTDIYVSLSPNITPEAEGVYTVSAGGSEIIGEGYAFSTFYVLGTGKAYIRGKRDAMSASFKTSAKGGGDGGGSTAKPVNYIHLYGTGVQGVGAIRVDYKHPLSKSGVENLCVLMTSLAPNNNLKSYYQGVATSDAVNPYDTYAEIIPYNFGSRPTILSIMITEPDN